MNDERERELYRFNRERYGEIIRAARTRQKLSQRELADQLGVAKNYISNWEAGRARPDLNLIPALCRALRLGIPAFFGEKSETEGLNTDERRCLRKYRRLTVNGRAVAEGLMDTLLRMAENELRARAAAYRAVTLHDLKVSAGTGNPLDDGSAGETVYVLSEGTDSRTDCLIRVTGDSMEPDFHDGDTLQVQYADAVREGEIGIFVADGDGYVKEYRADGLHSHNPAYPVLRFTDDDGVRCVGRVLGVLEKDAFAPDEISELRRAEEL